MVYSVAWYQIGWTARLDEDDEWWKPREHLELLCMQPKNDYFGSQIVAGKCKRHNSKQQVQPQRAHQ